jgi:hypothetical protein
VRIRGELLKLGHRVSTTSIRNLLRRHHIPSPSRAATAWWRTSTTTRPTSDPDRVLAQFINHYHQARPHQDLEQCPPCPSPGPVVPAEPGNVERRERLGGLIYEYRRAA